MKMQIGRHIEQYGGLSSKLEAFDAPKARAGSGHSLFVCLRNSALLLMPSTAGKLDLASSRIGLWKFICAKQTETTTTTTLAIQFCRRFVCVKLTTVSNSCRGHFVATNIASSNSFVVDLFRPAPQLNSTQINNELNVTPTLVSNKKASDLCILAS